MTLKEKFLEIKTYEEFDNRRTEFKDLDCSDFDVRKHISNIFPKVSKGHVDGVIIDLVK